jgi:LemA protein
MNQGIIFLMVLLVPALLAGGWWIAVHNRLVRLSQHVRESWADIDVELKRRHDLIPNLVRTVRGYAAHERELLAEVTQLREQAMHDTRPAELGRDETRLQMALGRLFARAEAYPDLKADRGFLDLQQELALTEDRLAAARRFYNANVRELNATVQSFPASLVAGGRFGVAEYFEVADEAERVAPRVAV